MGKFRVQDGYDLMKKAISELKDRLPIRIFFAANDLLAIGAIRALLEENIAVPDQVNIIGLNDMTVSKYIYPPLTTVKVHTELMVDGCGYSFGTIKWEKNCQENFYRYGTRKTGQ